MSDEIAVPPPTVNDLSGDVRLIAFYLTQFHPIPENDLWWGKGFTEWTNVTKAKPLFHGHYQPHLPADFGFYDLRVRETRREQIALAKAYGIDGFCYHYYWFSGRRLLERPLDDMLADPESDMPFCLCWANENWTRRWDAAEHEVLIAQRYEPDDDLAFIRSVEPFLRDPRYIRLGGAPLLIVYRPQHLPDAAKSLRVWREYCASVGIPSLHLACALTHGNWDYRQWGFDSGVEFPPHNSNVPDLSPSLYFHEEFDGLCHDYADVAEFYLGRTPDAGDSVFRGVFPSWDNAARRGRLSTVMLNGTPENYLHWLSEAIRKTREDYPGQDRLVFINAWNEWAEGCHLEPDRRYGHRFLDATRTARRGASPGWDQRGVQPDLLPPKTSQITYYRRTVAGPGPRKSLLSRSVRATRDLLNGRTIRRMLAERANASARADAAAQRATETALAAAQGPVLGATPRPGRLYISGTGRAGTTFLMELLTELGLDTGYDADGVSRRSAGSYFPEARAGLEWDIFDPTAPTIVKNPYLCDHVDDVIAKGLQIGHVIIPVRDIRSAAESRRSIQSAAGREGGVPGGLWDASAGHQESVLEQKFYRLVEALVRHEIPMTFLEFPRFATDEGYCFRMLRPFLPQSAQNRFSEAFRATSQPQKIGRFAERTTT